MKKFIKRILIFVPLVFLILAGGDYGWSELMMRTNDRPVEAWYDLMHGKIDADVIIMGNSRAWVHISPKILDSVLCVNSYNLGIDGSAMNRQIQKYHLLRTYNRKPELIIQNIDFVSMDYITGYEREQFFPYFWDGQMREEVWNTEPFSWKEKIIPFYRYQFKEPIPDVHFQPRELYKGYCGKGYSWNGKSLMELDSVSFKCDDRTMKMFGEYLRQAKAEGIKMVFVYTPMYIGATYKIKKLNEMYDLYENLADKYNIPILDYSRMALCNDTVYFYNAMHLNRRGAEIFSDSLANDIKRLGLTPNS